jgi:hypothetical protein
MSRVFLSEEVEVSTDYLWMDDPPLLHTEFNDLNSSPFLFVRVETENYKVTK